MQFHINYTSDITVFTGDIVHCYRWNTVDRMKFYVNRHVYKLQYISTAWHFKAYFFYIIHAAYLCSNIQTQSNQMNQSVIW